MEEVEEGVSEEEEAAGEVEVLLGEEVEDEEVSLVTDFFVSYHVSFIT